MDLPRQPAGANHRNELAHGLIDNYDQVNAALLVIAAMYLVAVAHFGEAQDNGGEHPRDGGEPTPPAG